MNVFTYVLLGASPTIARGMGLQSDPLFPPALLRVLCFLVRNFAPSVSFAYIYTDMYLFVHGLNAIIYLTRVFSVFSAFFSCFTCALFLHTALLQPNCKEGNKVCACQNKADSNPCIAFLYASFSPFSL